MRQVLKSAAILVTLAPGLAFAQAKTGVEGAKALVGNTTIGRDAEGDEEVNFFKPDGTLMILSGKDKSTAKWLIKDGKMCIAYDGEEGIDPECFGVTVNGAKATFTEEGDTNEAELIAGNPRKL